MTRKQHCERIAIVKKIAQVVTFHNSFIRIYNENLENTVFWIYVSYTIQGENFIEIDRCRSKRQASKGVRIFRFVTVIIFNRLQLVTTLTDFDITDTSYLTKLLKSNVAYNMNHSEIRNSTMPSYT